MKFFPQPMGYTTIICYVREGNKLIPYRFSQFASSRSPADNHVRKLEWAEIFGNHTSWVNERVKESEARYANFRKTA